MSQHQATPPAVVEETSLHRIDPVQDRPQRMVAPQLTGKYDAQTVGAAPRCTICAGCGWVKHAVPLGHPDFGVLFPCEAVIQTAIPWEGREYVLLDMLAPHLDEYDLILIDCRPRIDLSVTKALTAARWLLVPVECSFLALDAYDHVRALQHRLTQRINAVLALLGLLPTRYRAGTAHAQAALAEIEQQVAELDVCLHFAPVRLAVAAADAPAHGMTFAEFAPTSPIAQEYRSRGSRSGSTTACWCLP